jgi:hypothetical protein
MPKEAQNGPQVDWNDDNVEILADKMKDEIQSFGRLSDNGSWKSEQLTRIVTAFNGAKGQPYYNRSQIITEIAKLKNVYKIIGDLQDQSGFGWDEETSTVTAEDSVWDAYLAVPGHKEAKKWRNKSFKVFETLQYIYEGQLATGEFARTGTDGTALNRKRKDNVVLSGSPSAALHEESSPSIRKSPRLAGKSPSSSTSNVTSNSSTGSTKDQRKSGGKSGSKPPKSSKTTEKNNLHSEILDTVKQMAAHQARGTTLQQALVLVSKYLIDLPVDDGDDFKDALAEQPTLADRFITEDDAGRARLIRRTIEKLKNKN